MENLNKLYDKRIQGASKMMDQLNIEIDKAVNN